MLYLSEKTGKSYKTVKELEADEKKLTELESAEQKKKAEKKQRAEEVAKAYKAYEDVKAEYATKLREAYDSWVELRDEFAKDYGGYHMTYVSENGSEPKIEFGDGFEPLFLSWF